MTSERLAEAGVDCVSLATSDSVSRERMYDVATTVLQQKLSQVEGVGQAFVGGGALPAVRVELNPAALARYALSMEDVRAVAPAVLRHRLVLDYAARIEGRTPGSVIAALLAEVPGATGALPKTLAEAKR